MINLIKLEIYQLLRNKFFYGAVLLILAAPFMTLAGFESEVGIAGTGQLDALRVFTTMLLMSGVWGIGIGVIGAFFAGQRTENPSEKLALAAGHSRLGVFAADAALFLFFMNALMLLFPAAGFCIELTRMPFYLGVHPDTIGVYIARVITLTVCINCSVFSLILALKFAFQRAGVTAAATALILFGQYLLVAILGQRGIEVSWLPFTMQQYAVLIYTTPGEALKIAAVALIYTLVLLSTAYCLFCRREIK